MREFSGYFLIVVFVILFSSGNAFAACSGSSPNLIAASAARGDVADCITAATDGDTITIPAGSASWTSGLAMTKFIRLVGAGAGNTVITSNWTPGEKITAAAYIVSWTPTNPSLNLPFGVSGITFDLASKTCGFKVSNTSSTPITKLRVDNNIFSNTLYVSGGQRTYFIVGNVYGSIDSNTFDAGGAVYGLNNNWETMTFSYGRGDQLFIEDNTFNTTVDGNTGGGVGGRYCARYNTINRNSGSQALQAFEYHGNQGPGSNNAGMGMELYGNKLINTSGTYLTMQLFDHRGGMAVAHHNYVDTGGQSSNTNAGIREEFVDNTNSPPTGPEGQPQHVYSSYFWLNQKNGTNFDPSINQTVVYPPSVTGLLSTDLGRTIPQWNVDTWKGVTVFDGTTGVGCGTLAARPVSCTTGVGYWATDQSCSNLTGMVGANPTTPISGTLYKCTATNTWMPYYTPYTYPHPLRTGTADRPAPPEGLKFSN